MQAVGEKIETIHLYVVREEEPRPVTVLPLLIAALCLLGIIGVTIYSSLNPVYEHSTVVIPAHFFTEETHVTRLIIPTGIKVFPATTAEGTLTITNGSVVSQDLPAGLIFSSASGVEVVTDTSVFVPAGNANGFGTASVSTHALVRGVVGNLTPLAINAVYGTSLYIRNLSAFTGGVDSRTVKFVTPRDIQRALADARTAVTRLTAVGTLQVEPCQILDSIEAVVSVSATCQFVHFPRLNLPLSRIISLRLEGKSFIADVLSSVPPVRLRATFRR